ncbi:hypothetical protein JI735_19285 [Paenibacillus sonchi]|uniref:Uncharacterized protein n=1 Tax=Paenibacillus sonchi TaxID=373687 RepID=A0A974P7J8_9BACL|nr:hypothetical protein [Paenibacillus sonchi]MCE3203479.1 hypothetical protein [Paenibacillus sonchi]QQZ58877.1 hypothetical protein JI735_19285 [Paenibacillus sonchi]
MLRNIALILLSSFALLLFRDVVVTYGTYLKVEKSIEQALDAAIVAGTKEIDNQRGGLKVDVDAAREALRVSLIQNLNLNSEMANDLLHGSTLDVYLKYSGEIPRIEAQFDTRIDLIAGKWLGLSVWPLTVKKHTPYLSEFI